MQVVGVGVGGAAACWARPQAPWLLSFLRREPAALSHQSRRRLGTETAQKASEICQPHAPGRVQTGGGAHLSVSHPLPTAKFPDQMHLEKPGPRGGCVRSTAVDEAVTGDKSDGQDSGGCPWHLGGGGQVQLHILPRTGRPPTGQPHPPCQQSLA